MNYELQGVLGVKKGAIMSGGRAGRGFSLVEVMVALLVIAVGFTALLASVSVGLRTAQLTNADLTSYAAARSFVDLVEAHFSVPLDSLAFEDISHLAAGTSSGATNPYTTYFVPSDSTVINYNSIYGGTFDPDAHDLFGPSWGATHFYKQNDGNSASLTTSPGNNNPPPGSNALPTRWVGTDHRAGDNLSITNYYSLGPYRLMADFELLDVSSTNSAFKPYKITVWVFGLDFPKNKTDGSFYATHDGSSVTMSGYHANRTTKINQIQRRRKEALGVFEFTARLGKAVAPFR